MAIKAYTLDELLTLASTQSTPIRTLLNQLENETVNMKILQLNYQPKFNLTFKPLSLLSDSVTEHIRLQTQAGVTASIKMPFGLEANSTATLSNPFDDQRKLDYNFTVKYELLPGVKADSIQIQIQGKKETLESIAWDLQSRVEEVQIETTNRYYVALLSQKKLVLAEANLADAENDLLVSRELLKRGSVSENDLREKEVARNTSRIHVEQLRQQYHSNLNSLFTYVGLIPEEGRKEVIQLADSSEQLTATPLKTPETVSSVEELADVAIGNRLEHSEPYLSLKVAKEEWGRMQNWPVISAQFEYRPQSSASTVNKTKWALGIHTSYAFGESSKVQLEREKKQREIAELERQLAETRHAIYEEVQTRWTNVKIAYLNYQNAELELAKARADQTILDEQLKRGLLTEQAQRSGLRNVNMIELDLLQKRVDYQVAYWKLQQYVSVQLEQNGVME